MNLLTNRFMQNVIGKFHSAHVAPKMLSNCVSGFRILLLTRLLLSKESPLPFNTKVFSVALVILLISMSALAHAAVLGHDVDANWNITVSVDPVGVNARTKGIGVITDPSYNWVKDYKFQAQGDVSVSITAGYTGTAAGDPTIMVTTQNYGLSFTSKPGAVNEATALFPAEAFYTSEFKDSGYGNSWYLTIDLYVYDSHLGVASDSVSLVIDFSINQFRHIWSTYYYGDMYGIIGMYDLTYSSTGTAFTMTRSTVTGASVELSAPAPANLWPESGVTYDYKGLWGGVKYTLSYPLDEFLGALKKPVPITVSCEGYPPMRLNVDMYYAQIVSVDGWGGEEFKDPITSEWSGLVQGRFVSEGNQVRLTPVPVAGYIKYPWVRAVFADRTMHELALQPYDQEKMGPTIVTFGNDGVSGQQIAWTIKFTNLSQDIQLNGRDYAREFIWDVLVSQGVGYLTQGSGWLLQKVAKEGAKYVVRKGRERLSEGADNAPSYDQSLSSFSDLGDNQIVPNEGMISVPSGAVASGYIGHNQNVLTADAVISLTGAGTLRAENRFGSLEVLDLNVNQSALLGPGTLVKVDEAGISAPSVLAPPQGKIGNPLTITLAPWPVTSLTPLLTLTYSLAYNNYLANFKPESLVCRINGVLVTSYASISLDKATVQIANAAKLKFGLNTVTAHIWEASSGWHSASLTFSASGEYSDRPSGLTSFPGARSMILAWIGGSRYIDGYNVYKGSTSDNIITKINTAPVLLPSYPILLENDSDLAAGFWYAVRSVSGDVESALPEPVLAALNPGANQTPPSQVTALNTAPGDTVITVSFTPPADALCYTLERKRGNGIYQTIPAEGEYLCATSYLDRELDNGVFYQYRITPVGYDLIQGIPAESASTMPVNGPPAPPIGLSALPSKYGRSWTLAWNPQTESDLAGYNVYQASSGGQFAKVNSAPLTVQSKTVALVQSGLTLWRITSVDKGGLESDASATLLGGYGDSNQDDLFPWSMFLPAIISNASK